MAFSSIATKSSSSFLNLCFSICFLLFCWLKCLEFSMSPLSTTTTIVVECGWQASKTCWLPIPPILSYFVNSNQFTLPLCFLLSYIQPRPEGGPIHILTDWIAWSSLDLKTLFYPFWFISFFSFQFYFKSFYPIKWVIRVYD